MLDTFIIITSTNKLFKYKAASAFDALNTYVENELKYEVKFNISKENWRAICMLISSLEITIEFLNGFCKFPSDKISKIILEASTYPFEQTEIQYEISASFLHAIVVGCKADCDNAIIASTYDGLPVTALDSTAFDNCTNLTSITYLGTPAQWDAIENKEILSSDKSIEFHPLVEDLTLLSTRKNRLYLYDTGNAKEALRQHIKEVLGFNKRFEMGEDEWTVISDLSKSKPISVKVELINGLCRFLNDNIVGLSVGTLLYPHKKLCHL